MARALCGLVMCLTASLCLAADVEMLAEHDLSSVPLDPLGGDNTHPPHIGQDGVANEGPGYFKRIANFVGPKYGLPGYKESHNWQTGIDIFSPTVLNQVYYKAKYSLTGNEEALKKDWIDKLSSNINGACPKGRIDWDLNKYAANNPAAGVVKDENYVESPATCMQILENFLSTGIFEGLTGWTAFPVKKLDPTGTDPPAVRFTLESGLDSLSGNDVTSSISTMRPELTYTYTFWINVEERTTEESNIMSFVAADYSVLPSVSLNLKPASTDLVYRVSQSDAPDYLCEAVGADFSDAKPGYLELSKWHYITLVATKFHSTSAKMILYVDGAVACEKDNTAGTTMEPASNGMLYMSATGMPAAKAQMDQVFFYPDYTISAAEVNTQMGLEALPDY